MTVTDKMVERAAKAIARMVPTGSRWNEGYGYNFPQEYSEIERRLVRGIAKTCLEAAAAEYPQETTSCE